MFENSDAVSFATNGEATYHYSIPMPSGATLKTDGEKIVGRVEAPAFRIGGVYRQRNGVVARMDFFHSPNVALVTTLHNPTGTMDIGGGRNLSDGRYCGWKAGDIEAECSLFPGELVQRDGQWVAMEEAKPASMTPTLDALEAEAQANSPMIERDWRPKTERERTVMARLFLAKSISAAWEDAKKQPTLAHPYPFARNFQG